MLQELISSLKSLLIVTVINFTLVTGVTIGILYAIDRVREKKKKEKEE
jgi:hypothetical protein